MRKQVSFALALSMVMTSGMATVANAAADDGKTNVVFWNSWTGGDGDTLEALVNKFNEESDTVHVEMTRTTSFGGMLQTNWRGSRSRFTEYKRNYTLQELPSFHG